MDSTRDELRLSRRRFLTSATVGYGVTAVGLSQSSLTRGSIEADPPEYEAVDVTREDVWVETGTDTDDSGVPDRTHVTIARPAATDAGETLPVILRADPYDVPDETEADLQPRIPDVSGDVYETMNTELYRPNSTDDEAATTLPGTRQPQSITPGQITDRTYYYEKQLLPEGYIFAYASPIGTGLSTGCSTLGGEPEVQSIRAVIDWLNGRETAYSSRTEGETVEADWTTGTTGMIGGSYRGTLANGVATTGVDGLETIVPIRSISNWYMYVRSNGAVISPGESGQSMANPATTLTGIVTTREGGEVCDEKINDMTRRLDRHTGNYNQFWAERNYVPDADTVSASVLAVHGMYDTRVRPRQLTQWLDALRENEVPYKAWVHQGGHDDPREHDDHETAWVELIRRWFAYWLKGVENGVMQRPKAIVERPDGRLAGGSDWPPQRSESTSVWPQPAEGAFGRLTVTEPQVDGTERLVDNSELPPTDLLGDDHPKHRLVYQTDPLSGRLRLSGTPEPAVTLSVDATAGLFSAAVIDYGPTEAEIVNRGWMNLQNRTDLTESRPIEPGEKYAVRFPMESVEYVFEEGHRLGIMLYSSDYNVTKRPPNSPELTVYLADCQIYLPVVGGPSELRAVVSGSGTTTELFGPAYDYEGEIYEIGDIPATTEIDNEDESTSTATRTDEKNGDTPTETSTEVTEATATDSVDTDTPIAAQPTETEDADDDGAGMGVVGTIASLAGLSYLLGRTQDEVQ